MIKAAQNGDFDAFNRLIAGQKDKVYGLALKLTGNREDAEDIVQETFLKAVDNIDKFRMESSFGTWLYSIALNQIKARAVMQRRMDMKPIEDYLPQAHDDASVDLFDWGGPHKHLERKQIQELIETTLSEMAYIYSAPFILRYMEDMSVGEIARVLKISVPAAKSRILRARLALREKLTEVLREKSHEGM